MTDTELLEFAGRLHPLLLHLPIGLWIGVTALEWGGALVRRRAPRATVATLAWMAAITGVLGAATGWFLAFEDYTGPTLEQHRWLGVAAAAVGVLAAAVSGLTSRRPFAVLLAGELGTLLVAGHLGNELTRGANWLSEPFQPKVERSLSSAAGGSAADPNVPAAAPTPTFASAVLPLLADRCGKCHGESKQKGELALHTEAAIAKGGENGAVLAPGKPEESELVRRLLLPLDDDDHMPPEDKPQPSAAEVALLRAWIAAGAPFQGPFDAGATVATAAPGAGSDPAPAEEPAATGPTTAATQLADPKPPDPKPAAARPAAPANAVAALHERLVHAVPVADGEPGLVIDFAAIAPTMTEAEARTLLTPLLPWVQDLGLARVPVGNDLMALCAGMPMLERLDLRATRVTSDGLKTLADHDGLQQLVLAETRLDDHAVDALLAMPALRRVHVWKAGLSEPALQRLRQREGLSVEAGEQPGGGTLEVEPPPRLVKGGEPAPAPPGAATGAAPAGTPEQTLRPVNAACPVSGKPVDVRFVIVHEQRAVGFCCAQCPGRFWAEPARYPIGN